MPDRKPKLFHQIMVLSGKFSGSIIPMLLIFVCITAFMLGISVYANYRLGFYSEFENERYLPYYLSDTTVLQKIFDYTKNDVDGLYRARELSNFFNYLDTQIILISAKIGYPHLLSGVYYLIIFLIILIQARITSGWLNNRFLWINILTGILYITSPPIFLSGWYFRTSKVLVSLGISIFSLILFYASGRVRNAVSGGRLLFLLTAVTGILMGLSDELGVAFTAVFCLFAATGLIIGKNRNFGNILAGGITAIFVYTVYRSIIGPYIAFRFSGLYPTAWIPNFINSRSLAAYAAIGQITYYLSMMFGNIPEYLRSIPFILLWILTYTSLGRKSGDHGRIRTFITKSGLSALIILSGFLILSAILIPMIMASSFVSGERAIAYYPIPFMTFIFVSFHILVTRTVKNYPKSKYLLFTVISVLIFGNCLALPKTMDYLTASTTYGYFYYHITDPIIEAVRNPDNDMAKYPTNSVRTIESLRHNLRK